MTLRLSFDRYRTEISIFESYPAVKDFLLHEDQVNWLTETISSLLDVHIDEFPEIEEPQSSIATAVMSTQNIL